MNLEKLVNPARCSICCGSAEFETDGGLYLCCDCLPDEARDRTQSVNLMPLVKAIHQAAGLQCPAGRPFAILNESARLAYRLVAYSDVWTTSGDHPEHRLVPIDELDEPAQSLVRLFRSHCMDRNKYDSLVNYLARQAASYAEEGDRCGILMTSP
jgi:hypothetical protein